MHDQTEPRHFTVRLAFGRPLQHFQVAVRVAECHDRLLANESIDADRFARPVVNELDLWLFQQHRCTIPHLELDQATAANYLLRRYAISLWHPRSHELHAAARNDKGL